MPSRNRMRNVSSRETIRNVASRETIRSVSSRETIRPWSNVENVRTPARRSQPATPRQASVALDVVPSTPVVNRIGTQSGATPHTNNSGNVRPPPAFPFSPNATPQGPVPAMAPWQFANQFGGSPFGPYPYPQFVGPQHGWYAVPAHPNMLVAPPTQHNNTMVEDMEEAENAEDAENHTPTRAGGRNSRRLA